MENLSGEGRFDMMAKKNLARIDRSLLLTLW